MLNKSASKVGTLMFKNGNETTIWIGSNSNTGATIVWQKCNYNRIKRMTGKNIPKLVKEIIDAIGNGECFWDGHVNKLSLEVLMEYMK